MPPELTRALLTVIFGALAGGLTNTVAVWMLFHPYEPARLGRLRLRFLHGAIPKNQGRLAEAIGRAVGDKLLTQNDLTHIFSSPEFRDAFDRRLEGFLSEALERERGSLRETLPPELGGEVRALLNEGIALLLGRLEAWIDSPAFEEFIRRRTGEFLARVSEHPVGDFLTPAREATLLRAMDEWLTLLVEREGFRGAIEDYLDRLFTSFLREERTFEEVLPAGLVSSLERALSEYLPLTVRKLGGILEDPGARRRLEDTVRELFDRLVRDLRFHQRLMARLVVNEETVGRVLETLEAEGAQHLSDMLRDPAVQDAMAGRINAAVLDFLQKPVTSVLGRPEDENVLKARETIAGWILGATRDPATREFLLERLRQALGRAAGGDWGALLREIPLDRLAELLISIARSDAARQGYREALERVLLAVLERPLGRPADWLPLGSAGRIQGALSEPLWGWLQTQTPQVIRTLDVGRRVEEKVRAYPTARLEELVRRVTQRELKLIVRLGYVLGAMIGGILVGLNLLVT